MTHVAVRKHKGHIVSVECHGHCGYAAEGEDIVCAALSSVIQTAILGLFRVVGVQADYHTNGDTGELSMKLGEMSDANRHDCDVILDTMLLGIADLYEGFSGFINLEVKDDVY